MESRKVGITLFLSKLLVSSSRMCTSQSVESDGKRKYEDADANMGIDSDDR